MRRAWLMPTGAVVVLLALYVAIGEQFNHFYEFLLLGLFLILLRYTPRTYFTTRTYVKLYIAFVLFGLIVDLVIGQTISNLWHYSYTQIWEYVLLYLMVYPLGGFVMLQSYLLGLHIAQVRRKVLRIPFWIFVSVFFVIMGSFAGVLLLGDTFSSGVWKLAFSVSAIFSMGAVILLLSESWYRRSYLRDLIENPLPILAVTLVATAVHVVIHEYPNVFAEQWIYTIQTGTTLDSFVLGIPIAVWVGWLTLLVGPATLYYVLHPSSQQ